ncbi:hypothetical protein RRG08_009077 [Elysia crispata]|uniref:Uncharacterized protein n=1 Tax=Elysia crispata TaxID=231223 RepID=A0AAE0Y7T8_9GAST|nr:hypothetical protein RRG08_009077 [Elysia crispata]
MSVFSARSPLYYSAYFNVLVSDVVMFWCSDAYVCSRAPKLDTIVYRMRHGPMMLVTFGTLRPTHLRGLHGEKAKCLVKFCVSHSLRHILELPCRL